MRRFSFVLMLALYGVRADAGDLPDPTLTPGLADPALTRDVICARDFRTSSVRDVSAATKREVYRSYGMTKEAPPCPCEVDHLIPLEIGGSNSALNLWPQPMTGAWNSRMKDRLEKALHGEVCTRAIGLEAAQREIATDWIAAWRKRFER